MAWLSLAVRPVTHDRAFQHNYYSLYPANPHRHSQAGHPTLDIPNPCIAGCFPAFPIESTFLIQ